jgi:pyruvate/2-oxoglutarate dehydrogenase complex dihydrolipoamide dehydrogenase (E3) component
MNAYDLAVIGGGSAGYAAARTAAASGANVAVIEGGKEVGGLCILRGCMPTKALLESAHRLHEIERAQEFGIKAGKSQALWPKIIERKNALVEDFAKYRRHQLIKGKFDFIRARAKFVDSHTLEISPEGKGKANHPQKLLARSYIIATGSVVDRLPIPGLEQTGYMTSDEAIHWDKLLKSIIILGGGAIAVEFAQYFLHLGVRVTLIQRNAQLLKNHDADVASVLETVFRREGMRVYTGTDLVEVKKLGQNKSVVFEQNGKKMTVAAEEILYALGRRPATEGMGLEQAGVALKGSSVAINSRLQTSQPHIFAVGDVSGPYEVVHTAITQGEAAARNALKVIHGKMDLEEVDYRLHMEIIFTAPEIASVGLSEKEAKKKKISYLAATYPFNDHGKSMIMGATDGFVKVLADAASGEILGAQIAGPHASDLIHEFVVAMLS